MNDGVAEVNSKVCRPLRNHKEICRGAHELSFRRKKKQEADHLTPVNETKKMKNQIQIIVIAALLPVVFAATLRAQPQVVVAPQQFGLVPTPQTYVPPPQTYVPPPQTYVPPPQTYVPPPQNYYPPQNQYYFGMTVSPLHSRPGAGQTSRIQSVTPGSPAAVAGLEAGDEIISVNGRRFPNTAFSATQVSQFLNNAVSQTGSSGNGATVQGGPRVRPQQGVAHMVVVNVRNGQHTSVTVYPSGR